MSEGCRLLVSTDKPGVILTGSGKMDYRGLCFITETLILVVCLTGCCPNMVNSETSPPFKGLECTCGANCTYGIQKCELIRCVCPYQAADYAANVNCSDELCPNNCCGMLPVRLQSETATHFMYSEKYQNYNESKIVQTILLFTKLTSSSTARWVMTLITEHMSNDQEEPVVESIFFSEANITSDTGDSLDNEGEIPTVFQDTVDKLETAEDFAEPLQCNVNFNTNCDEEFCSCLIYPDDMPLPVIKSFRNIPENNIVYDIGNSISTLETSSNLALFNSIDVTRRPSGTIGGWAPTFNDTNPWVKFSDVQWDVCGVVIQGADWTSSRRLDKFTVKTERGEVTSLDGVNYFVSGVVLYSKSVHLFSTPAKAPEFLQIDVVEPVDPLKVGFRASLITCGSAVGSCTGGLVESLTDLVKESLEKHMESKDNPAEDPIELVSEFYHIVQLFLDGNFDKYVSPGERSFHYIDGNIEIEITLVGIKDLQKKGYYFSNSLSENSSTDYSASISIPPGGVVHQNDDNPQVVVLASVTQHNDSEIHSDVNDDDRFRYRIISPIVTTRIFINGSECANVIEEITVKMEYGAITDGEVVPYFFKEECVNRSSGKYIHWSISGCESDCNEKSATCEMRCNHATSFAVLQLVGDSKLSESGKKAASILTTIGSVISIISLVTALVIYFLLRSSIATAQYAIHSNLMFSLLVSLCIFMTLLVPSKSHAVCKATMFLLQYFFSAAFCWMLCEGIHLYRQIITVFDSGKKHNWMYFVIGWAAPLVFVSVAVIGIMIQESKTDNSCCENRKKPCFFSHEDGSIWYFMVPVLVVILINTGILARVTVVVVKAAKIQAEKDSSQAVYQAKAGLRSALLLIPLLGCSYFLGFLSSVHGAFEIIYDIINSLQGFFLALFYCVMNKEIRTAIRTYIKRSRDMSTIQASTTGTNVHSRFYPEVSKRKNYKKNQVDPAEEPLELCHLEDVD